MEGVMTREEMYLAYLSGEGTELPEPMTRNEEFLYNLCMSGYGAPSQEQVSTALESYLQRNPIEPGATTEEAAQIQANKDAVETIKNNDEQQDAKIQEHTTAIEQLQKNGTGTGTGTGSGGNVDDVGVEPAYEDIPKVFFGGALQQTKDEKVVPFRYISKTDDFSGFAEIKAQGNSSMNYPKKNQTVKMFADEACDSKMKKDFKGWGKQNKHVYKANWIDLTHARNVVSARLWADVVKSRSNYADLPELLRTSPNQGAVDGFPVKVYAAGEYQGRYTLNIPKDAWMANMDKDLDTHCILCGEGYASGCFRDVSVWQWTDEVHDSMPTAIRTRWLEIIDFVMNSTDEDFKANLGNYFYVDSLIDYYLFGLASCGLDAFGKNQLYMTYDGQKWIASMYDMDSTWGLYWSGAKIVSSSYGRNEYEDFVNTDGNLLYNRLEELFYEELQARWVELRNGALSIENIVNRFERFTDIASAELVKEDYASTTGGGNFTGIPSKSTNNIGQIRGYALARRGWVDEYVEGLTPEVEVPCTGITLDKTELTFTAEGSQTLTATVTPDGCTDKIMWESNNTSIATVSGGVVTAVANGSAVITAKCGNYSASCSVVVSGIVESIPCTGISLDKTELTFDGEGVQTITATVIPSDTTDTVVWVSSNPSVSSITVDNNVCTVNSVSNGDATITVTCGSQTATCAVTVSGIGEKTLLYSLAEETSFNGTSDYIDTGIMLYDEDKDFTIVLDFQPSGTSKNNTILCSYLEASPHPGFCFRQKNGTYRIDSGIGGVALDIDEYTTNRYKVAIRHTAGSNIIEEIHSSTLGLSNWFTANETRQAFTDSVRVGCALDYNGLEVRFWSGTVYKFEIYSGAFNDSEMIAAIGYKRKAINITNTTWTSGSKVSSDGTVVTGNNYVSDFVEITGGTRVELKNGESSSFGYLGIWEYDENKNYITGSEQANKTLQANTKYVRLSAYSAKDKDPANQLLLNIYEPI